MDRKTYAVVGAGASGIAAAYYLQQQGYSLQIVFHHLFFLFQSESPVY